MGFMGEIFQNPTIRKQTAFTKRQKQYLDSHTSGKPKRVKHEESLQRQVCHYLRLQWPALIFRSDTDSGRWQYSRHELHNKVAMHSSKSFPDLFIYEPRTIGDKHYCGLAIELKKDGATVIMKIGPRKGRLSTDKHIQEQAAMLKSLIHKGYYANFAVGFDEAIKIIDWYMGKPQNASMF